MPEFHLSARNITVFRGERCLIKNLTLDLREGEILHLIGPNGCGKTSLLRVLAGLSVPEDGELLWQDRPVAQSLTLFQQQLGWLGHHAGLKSDLTLLENLQFDNALRRRLSDAQLINVLTTLGIEQRLDVPAGALSAGQRRRAALARVLVSQSPLWMLDEPLTNLDNAGRIMTLDLMRQHVLAGGAIIFAAHQDVVIDGVTVRRLEWQADD